MQPGTYSLFFYWECHPFTLWQMVLSSCLSFARTMIRKWEPGADLCRAVQRWGLVIADTGKLCQVNLRDGATHAAVSLPCLESQWKVELGQTEPRKPKPIPLLSFLGTWAKYLQWIYNSQLKIGFHIDCNYIIKWDTDSPKHKLNWNKSWGGQDSKLENRKSVFSRWTQTVSTSCEYWVLLYRFGRTSIRK